MPLKGLDKFRQKIPSFSGKKIAILPIFMILMVAVAFFIYISFDTLPATINPSETSAALYPLVGAICVMSIGFILVWQMWFWRNRLKAKYRQTSYQHIFLVGFGGVTWILTVAVNQYIPFYLFAPTYWANSALRLVSTPIEALFGNVALAILVVRCGITIMLLLTGLLMIIRSIQVFGIDYMVVLYLYFPEESKIQENEIYSVLRHPTYAGALVIGLGGTFFVFTPLSFLTFFLFLIAFYIHIHFIEERELIQRFGSAYNEYRKTVPPFFFNPKKLRPFIRYLTNYNNRKTEEK
jgi:protein-S-isoprenylcysteine O-methyltransferase Ste14